MRYAEFLKENGTLGFVAPSFGCASEPYHTAFLAAQEKWKQMGFSLELGPNCYEGAGIGISGSPEDCGRELTDYYRKSTNDCLISCGGGELMCEILDHVDFDALRAGEPKWFMGYSDNTNFTFLLATLCDTASFYGPCASSFGMEPWHESLWDAMDLLMGKKNSVGGYPLWEKETAKNEENPLAPYHTTQPRRLKVFSGGRFWNSEETQSPQGEKGREMPAAQEETFRGRLLGGCMDCLVNLLGTRYDKAAEFAQRYREDGIIWFLEACDLNVFGIRRAMWQMEHAGWFAHVKGFLIGRPLCFGQELMGLDAYRAVLEVAGKKGVPVVMDVDLGHLPPMMPLMVGSLGQVTVRGNEIKIVMEARE
ncbi:MAG: LD-carboxypeptidase [Clostridium sp.]|jgi:muramoyltetrapeptide carboxypeptidase LdcA involved in peptidoglycan recycling|nr:LD-carboxypeptidase [Clostridium sp.]